MRHKKLYANMHVSCEVMSIGEIGCSYRATFSLDEHYVAMLEIIDVKKEFYHKIKYLKELIIRAKAPNACFTLRGNAIVESKFSLQKTNEGIDNKVQICLRISDVFAGTEYAVEENNVLLFNGFSCQFTDTFQLFGLYPYKIDNMGSEWLFKEGTIADDTKTMKFDGGYSCFVTPYIYKKNDDYVFSMQGRLNYFAAKLESIEDLKEKIRMLVLFFEVLSGETITALDIIMENDKCSFEYLGLCNYPKQKLKGLYNGFDSKWYPRKSIFKLSDWKNIEKDVFEIFAGLVKDNLLAMESYKQVLLDEEIEIVTYNKFLKIMQMIEGIMRTAVSDEEKRNFEKRKKKIKKHLENQEDREFIDSYCFNNGDKFRTCLVELTKESVSILSGVENVESFNMQLSNIINDRNAYTHASKEISPVMNLEQTEAANCCYKEFCRIRILKQLNLSDQIICSRFMFNRKFVEAYRDFFGLSIKNMDEKHNTGEFDDMMSDYI